jgi:hypothetical protein
MVNQRQSSFHSKQTTYVQWSEGKRECHVSFSVRLTTTFSVVFYNILPALENVDMHVAKMRNLTGHVGVHGWQGADRNERTVSVRYNICFVNFYRVQ